MLKSVYYFLRYSPFYFSLFKDFRRINKYSAKLFTQLKKEVEGWEKTVDRANQKRMLDYIVIQTMWTAGFSLLRGRRISNKELAAAVNISALAPFYDDFFDKKNTKITDLESIINNPFNYTPKTQLEKICLIFSKNIHKNVADINRSLIDAKRVFNAQSESKKLHQKSLSEEEVRAIAFEKGAATVICMCNLLKERLSEKEERLMFQLGGVAQFLDDIFDLREDYLEGRQTLMNPLTSAVEKDKSFKKEIVLFKDLLDELDYSRSNKKAFMFPVTFILGATLLCLERYKFLEKKSGGKFKVEKYTRKELVVDMDDWSNRLKALSLSRKV